MYDERHALLKKIKFWCGRGWEDKCPNMTWFAMSFWQDRTSYAVAFVILLFVVMLVEGIVGVPAIVETITIWAFNIACAIFVALGIVNLFILVGWFVLRHLGVFGMLTVLSPICIFLMNTFFFDFYSANASLIWKVFFAILAAWITQWIVYGYCYLKVWMADKRDMKERHRRNDAYQRTH